MRPGKAQAGLGKLGVDLLVDWQVVLCRYTHCFAVPLVPCAMNCISSSEVSSPGRHTNRSGWTRGASPLLHKVGLDGCREEGRRGAPVTAAHLLQAVCVVYVPLLPVTVRCAVERVAVLQRWAGREDWIAFRADGER